MEDEKQEAPQDGERQAMAAAAAARRAALPAKGACWYCDKALDSVRRFCGKPCAAAYDEEAQYPR